MKAIAKPVENNSKKIVIVPMGSKLVMSGSEGSKKNILKMATPRSGEEKIVPTHNSEKNKTKEIILAPITQIRQIGKNEITSPRNLQLINILNAPTNLTQNQANKIMIIKPMADEVNIEDIISTKSPSDTGLYDPLQTGDQKCSDDDRSSNANEKSQIITPEGGAFIKEDTPNKRKHVQSDPLGMDDNSKLICSSVNTDKTNTTEVYTTSNVSEISTQTGHYSTPKEEELERKIRAMNRDIRRRKLAHNQLRTVVRLIKNKCKTYDEVKEVLKLKLKQIPHNLDCSAIIIAP